jgi:hypothetical protein
MSDEDMTSANDVGGSNGPGPEADVNAQQVEELGPEMSGVWEVETRGSTHIWDLDVGTYQRLPGPRGRPMSGDGVPQRITWVGHWPRVGDRSYVVYDDADIPQLLEHWRYSGTILSIRQAQIPASPDW